MGVLPLRLVVSAGAIIVIAAAAVGPASAGPSPDPPPDLRNPVAAAAVVDELWDTRQSWAGTAAGNIAAIHPYNGGVLILTQGETDRIRGRIPIGKREFVTVARGGVAYAQGGPGADQGGWTGGNHINDRPGAGAILCTEGFTWRSWRTSSAGAIYGSTAAHCYRGGLSPYWYNNGRYVGRVTQLNLGAANDVAFLRAASGTSFNASIWVHLPPAGPAGGVEERTVTGAGANTLGGPIAFYGRTSGGGNGTVGDLTFNGLNGRIWTNAIAVRPGDSGGPVYTTYTNGTVQARGTVSGLTYIDNNGNGIYNEGDTVTGMYFADATHTSAEMQASIYTP
jgi:hypothetical protein